MKKDEKPGRAAKPAATNSWRSLLILWLIVLAWYSQVGPGQQSLDMVRTRLDLLHSIFYEHTLKIDAYHTNTVDLAYFRGHYYCDKAPGLLAITLPAFCLASKVISISSIPPNSEAEWLWSGQITVTASISMLSAIGAVCLFLWLQGFMPSRVALICTLVTAFGSVMLPYSVIMMSHGVTIALLGISFWCLRLGHEPAGPAEISTRATVLRDILGGITSGLAIACEYNAALVVGGAMAVIMLVNFRRSFYLTLGLIPPLLLIPAYNLACFGSPFSLPYGHEVVFTEMSQGFFGIHMPNMGILFDNFFSPSRGLFFWTPFLLLAYPGYYFLSKKSRPMFWLCYTAPLLHAFIISGYFFPEAGWTLGARLLAPIIPLLILPAGMMATRFRGLAILLGIISIIMMGGATLVNIRLPYNTKDPFFDYYLPSMLQGKFILGQGWGNEPIWLPLLLLVSILAGWLFLWRDTGELDRQKNWAKKPL